MRQLTAVALSTAKRRGAKYADIRIVETRTQAVNVKNGAIGGIGDHYDIGFGVRVIANGAWGFAASNKVTKKEIERVAANAVKIAKAAARVKSGNVRLAPEPIYDDRWQTPYLIDPFDVPLEEKLDILYKIDGVLRKDKRIRVASGSMSFLTEHQWLATSEGTFIDQKLMRSGAGYAATAVKGGEAQIRSYPASFRGQFATLGYELIESLHLLDHADRVRDEAIALLTAPQCPSGVRDLILDGHQMALQIHESVGHASELDRVIGMEANYAGTSFATTEKLGRFRYGSPIVNLVADSTVPAGLGTIGYDDDGVRAQRWHIVKDGIFSGYQTNREVAHYCGDERSRGCCRAQGWSKIPMVRNTNLSLMPGDWTLEDLIADTKKGILMATNKSWSIDQKRLNFQFGTEIAWEIKNGKLGRIYKNPTYQGITPEFW
ncbi:MAG: TldD/PmbA family protein, partial [Planctomycetota bacterium]